MSRPYTGFDGYASGKRDGTEEFIRQFIKLTNGAFWKNGSFNKRNKRGKNSPSIHGTGRAVDLSYRGAPYSGCGDREVAAKWIDWLVEHADELHIELIIDYMPKPYGRGWKCDRNKWRRYTSGVIGYGGKSWADWIHVEIAPTYQDDASFYRKVFDRFKGETVDIPERRVVEPYRGRPIRRGEKDRDLVKRIQRVVGAKVDGYFGPKTEKAVMRWQGRNNCYPDGWIGPKTWAVMAPHLN